MSGQKFIGYRLFRSHITESQIDFELSRGESKFTPTHAVVKYLQPKGAMISYLFVNAK